MYYQLKTQKQVLPPANVCRCCGRSLTDPISVELGMGPICRIHQKTSRMQEQTLNLFGNRAQYTWDRDGDIIAIVDADNGYGPSVTNDIQNVLRYIALELGEGLQDYRILYRDSRGIWDGVHILSHGGRHTGGVQFYSINERDYQRAKAKIA